MSFFRRKWRWVLSFSIVGAGFILVGIFWVLKKRREAENLRAELAFLRAGAKVDGLEADRAARQTEIARDIAQSARIDAQIRAAKRQAVSQVLRVEKMSDTDVAAAFRRMGY